MFSLFVLLEVRSGKLAAICFRKVGVIRWVVFAFSVCFASLPFLFSGPLRGLLSPGPQCSEVWLHSASVLGFPTGPWGGPVVFRKPHGPVRGWGVAGCEAVGLLLRQEALTGVLRGLQPDLLPASLRWSSVQPVCVSKAVPLLLGRPGLIYWPVSAARDLHSPQLPIDEASACLLGLLWLNSQNHLLAEEHTDILSCLRLS